VDHLLATVVVSAALPHFFKKYINQTRPDRAVAGHNGIRKSGKPRDAFPSGHAVHLGAVASALSWQRPKQKKLIWGTALSIAATRVVVLAHWASDVGVGLIAGASLERLLRHVIGSRRRSQGTNDNRQGHL
jgi:undecaprenyl-diphosphatase